MVTIVLKAQAAKHSPDKGHIPVQRFLFNLFFFLVLLHAPKVVNLLKISLFPYVVN